MAARKWICMPFSAALIIFWSFLMYGNFFLMIHFTGNHAKRIVHGYKYYFTISVFGSYLFSPFLGLLADVWIGRYRTIMAGVLLCFMSWLITGISYIVFYFYNSFVLRSHYLWLSLLPAYICLFVGFASFRVNVIQYNIDQLVGASADELNTVIYWQTAMEPLIGLLFFLMQCLFDHDEYSGLAVATFTVSGLFLTIILVSHSHFQQRLENLALMVNPVKLIVRVLCYARKHKYPENRSALTYWEEEAPSRLDLGKDKYGGPFTEEEVEDVKTVFRMLPLFIAITGSTCSANFNWYTNDQDSLLSCILPTNIPYYLLSFIFLLAYLYCFRICCYKLVPNMLCRMKIGLLFSLATVTADAVIFVFKENDVLLLLPHFLHSISFIFLNPVSLEFTVAQSPVHMRGVMVGLWYASWGTGYLLDSLIKFPFKCEDEYLCTSFHYYLTKLGLVFLILIVFGVFAKRYKYRVRENEVNIVQIVGDHYQKYIEQEEEYNNKEKGFEYTF
uniref:Major facilitator superfamily associated domain-containing protein n=1 Tax=Amphimedon queenslandica TaxID=400682 RepID=A0A1X7VDS5_AMPQE